MSDDALQQVHTFLLALHIAAGAVALLSALVAAATKTLATTPSRHVLHLRSGRCFYVAMVVIFGTALPMTWIRPNPFLALVAVFSFYLAWTGWRLAKIRDGRPRRADWFGALLMTSTALAMVIYAAFLWGQSVSIVLLAFGSIGLGLGTGDLRRLRSGGLRGRARIARHLSRMLAGTIATITAFVVTNFSLEPEWLLWLAPTFLISPFIAWSVRRVLRVQPVHTAGSGAGL